MSQEKNSERELVNLVILISLIIGIVTPFGYNQIHHYRQTGWPYEDNDDRSMPAKEYNYNLYANRIEEEFIERNEVGIIENSEYHTTTPFYGLIFYIAFISLVGYFLSGKTENTKESDRKIISRIAQICFCIFVMLAGFASSTYYGDTGKLFGGYLFLVDKRYRSTYFIYYLYWVLFIYIILANSIKIVTGRSFENVDEKSEIGGI